MNQTEIRMKAIELWNVLKGREQSESQCVDMIANALRNTARELADEEHALRLKAEAEVARLKEIVEAAPVAGVVA